MAKGFRRMVGFLLVLWAVLMLNIPAVYAAETVESKSGMGTTFTFTMEETTSGNSENMPEAKASPQTGDTSNLALWITLLFVSGGAAIGATVVSRKKKYNR